MHYETTIKTRYSETGQDGIIHHSSYVVYMEVARIGFFKELGLDINQIEKEGLLCPVTKLSCHYLKPLHSLEEVTVKVVVSSFTRVRFELHYEIFNGDVCVFKGTSENCFLNAQMKPIPIPQKFATKLKINLN